MRNFFLFKLNTLLNAMKIIYNAARIFFKYCAFFSGSVLFKLSHVLHISDKKSPFLRVVKH